MKEVYQLIKFSNNISERLPFEKLLNSYQYGDKVSPWGEMNYEKLAAIEKELKKRVIGQDHAIEKVKNVVYKTFTGLSGVQYSSKRTKPKGILFFIGPTRVDIRNYRMKMKIMKVNSQIKKLIDLELKRQQDHVEFIAS